MFEKVMHVDRQPDGKYMIDTTRNYIVCTSVADVAGELADEMEPIISQLLKSGRNVKITISDE